MKRFLSVVGAVLLMAAGPASADVIFTFDGLTFDDGGTLDGTFTTDDALMTLLDYDLTTSGGSLAGFTYTPGTAPLNFSSLPSVLVVETSTNNPILQVTFASLMATGGLITLGSSDSFEQVGAGPSGRHGGTSDGRHDQQRARACDDIPARHRRHGASGGAAPPSPRLSRHEKRPTDRGWAFAGVLVAKGGIEPPTQGFSVLCSTN